MPKSGGHTLRDAFEKDLWMYPAICQDCSKKGVIGSDLHVGFSRSDVPPVRTYTVWTICDDCAAKRTLEKPQK